MPFITDATYKPVHDYVEHASHALKQIISFVFNPGALDRNADRSTVEYRSARDKDAGALLQQAREKFADRLTHEDLAPFEKKSRWIGATPLHIAAYYRSSAVMDRILEDNPAAITALNTPDAKGRTVLDWAEKRPDRKTRTALVKLLESHGARRGKASRLRHASRRNEPRPLQMSQQTQRRPENVPPLVLDPVRTLVKQEENRQKDLLNNLHAFIRNPPKPLKNVTSSAPLADAWTVPVGTPIQVLEGSTLDPIRVLQDCSFDNPPQATRADLDNINAASNNISTLTENVQDDTKQFSKTIQENCSPSATDEQTKTRSIDKELAAHRDALNQRVKQLIQQYGELISKIAKSTSPNSLILDTLQATATTSVARLEAEHVSWSGDKEALRIQLDKLEEELKQLETNFQTTISSSSTSIDVTMRVLTALSTNSQERLTDLHDQISNDQRLAPQANQLLAAEAQSLKKQLDDTISLERIEKCSKEDKKKWMIQMRQSQQRQGEAATLKLIRKYEAALSQSSAALPLGQISNLYHVDNEAPPDEEGITREGIAVRVVEAFLTDVDEKLDLRHFSSSGVFKQSGLNAFPLTKTLLSDLGRKLMHQQFSELDPQEIARSTVAIVNWRELKKDLDRAPQDQKAGLQQKLTQTQPAMEGKLRQVLKLLTIPGGVGKAQRVIMQSLSETLAPVLEVALTMTKAQEVLVRNDSTMAVGIKSNLPPVLSLDQFDQRISAAIKVMIDSNNARAFGTASKQLSNECQSIANTLAQTAADLQRLNNDLASVPT